MTPIAERALKEGVSMLGVATVNEAIALRHSGIRANILVMGQPVDESLSAIVEHNLRVMISSFSTAERLGSIAHKAGKVAAIHCKVDTGMGRQGFPIETAANELYGITRIANVDIEGVATHFPVSDLPNDAYTINQVKAFKQLLKQLDKNGTPYEFAHAANSAALIQYPDSVFNMVRPGLMTYGVWPLATPAPDPSFLRPVLRWETKVTLVRDLEPGSSVGYGRTYTTPEKTRVAVLPVGYADGYKHSLSNNADVLIRGTRCPVRGSVCMDQIIVDVTRVPEAAPGDVAVLIGGDGGERITAEELAARAKTIPYDILAGIGLRVHRDYVG
jgi:alanine racemase